MKKFASAITPGDKLESNGGVLTVVRAHTINDRVHVICTNQLGQLTNWANYDPFDEFALVTLH